MTVYSCACPFVPETTWSDIARARTRDTKQIDFAHHEQYDFDLEDIIHNNFRLYNVIEKYFLKLNIFRFQIFLH